MKLTLGMACHDDFHGVAFSIQSLRLHQGLGDYEILVVDNQPASPHGQATAKFCQDLPEVRYLPMPEKTGTSQSRERVFAEARGEAVAVMDCHVLFPPGTLSRLAQFYEANPDCRDLLSGPLILNHFRGYHTHYNPQWRAGMWGTWGTAWTCTCGPKRNLRFTTLEVAERVQFRDLASCSAEVTGCPCGRKLPTLPWPGHEARLVEAGFQPLGFSDDDPYFEVPGQGLGFFTCLKAAWPGFHPEFRGFGGEELYIHAKFRRAGGRALCLPWLKWWHRFERPDGVKYPLSHYLKVRNYVLGHQELQLELAPVFDHFVSLAVPAGQTLRQHLLWEHGVGPAELEGKSDQELEQIHRGKKLSQEEWEFLLADPVSHVQLAPTAADLPLETGRPQPPAGATLEEIYQWCRGVPRDLEQHLPLLRGLAEKCTHVTEITKRRESTVGLLAGRPQTLVSYQKEPDVLLKTLAAAITRDAQEAAPAERRVATHTIHWGADSAAMNAIEPTDLLYIDSVHSAERLQLELDQHASRVGRFLVLRGTGAFGEVAEGGQSPGLFAAVRPFLEAHPDWFIVFHTGAEYGMTVLGKQPADRPEEPVHAWPPGFGPGTEFKRICGEDLGITMPNNCTCNALAVQMDIWGPAGCRTHSDAIVAQIKANQDLWGWTAAFKNFASAAVGSLKSGLWRKVNWTDPIPGLVQEAIRRAEAGS